MQITLKQVHIEQAIRNFIAENVAVSDENRVDVEIHAKRGDEGIVAIAHIVDIDAPELQVQTKSTAPKTGAGATPRVAKVGGTGRKPGPKPKPRDANGNIIRDSGPVATEPQVEVAKTPVENGTPITQSDNAYVDKVVEAGTKTETVTPETTERVTQTATEDLSDVVDAPVAEPTQEQELAAEAARTEPVEETPAPATTPASGERQSLFSGLRKPQNS